jgi:N6-adenosine-specific RNA methylase IME4
LTWIKPRLGLGNYLRNATEHLIFGTRGRAPVNYKAQPTWLFAPLQDHSHKPEEQYLELFARRRQHGWDAWGNQVDSDIQIPGYPVSNDHRKAS